MRSSIARLSHFLYKSNYSLYLSNFDVKKSIHDKFVEFAFSQSYARFSPIHYLPASTFQRKKVLYNFLSLMSLSKLTKKSIEDLISEYTWDLKYKIRDQAIGLKLNDLSKSWGKENVALFNCFNTIKFRKKVFNNIPLYRARVLDFGSSIGCASFLSSNYDTFSHTISDVPGYPLDVAEETLLNCGLRVKKIAIENPEAPPEYEKGEFDVVYCLHTLEHTTNPLKTCRNLLYSLRPGGYIIYTYYKASDPDGINTPEALHFRKETLNFLKKNTESTKINNLKPYIVAIKK